MKITSAPHELIFGQGAPGYERSKGVHMSDLYNDLFKKLYPKRFDKRDSFGEPVPMPMDKVELGLVFEEMLEAGLKTRLAGDARPGEFVTQHESGCIFTDTARITPCRCGAGIAYSPDLLIFNGDTKLGEIKLTWYSTKNVPVSKTQAEEAGRPELENSLERFEKTRFDKWMSQIMAYLFHLRREGIVTSLTVKLIVFFVNGNYIPPSPVPLAWWLTFTERELQENWSALKNHAVAEGMLG